MAWGGFGIPCPALSSHGITRDGRQGKASELLYLTVQQAQVGLIRILYNQSVTVGMQPNIAFLLTFLPGNKIVPDLS
ncbi:MAG TPA: hypothetical protein DIT01_09070 [Lentisphaeria bacterium]|nr:hypothetical protein [Lentisphaeria bacterium]